MYQTLTLATLPLGESAYVTYIHALPDMEQRLTDLGLVPGTKISCAARSPAGDPRAYLVRGSLIALRNADAQGIGLSREEVFT